MRLHESQASLGRRIKPEQNLYPRDECKQKHESRENMKNAHERRQHLAGAALQGRLQRPRLMRAHAHAVLVALSLLVSVRAVAVTPVQIKIRDLISVEGVRENPLIGYGMIVGLNGTGDKQQTVFAVQTLAGILQRMGVQISPAAVRVKNVAAVFVTANLAPFARPGAHSTLPSHPSETPRVSKAAFSC